MTRENPTYVTDASLVNCIVPVGKADEVLKAARDFGVGAGVVYRGRGIGLRERLGLIGITVEAEKEVVVMIVANERLDMVIDRLYQAADMSTLAAGFIYATPLEKAALYIPEDVLQRLQET